MIKRWIISVVIMCMMFGAVPLATQAATADIDLATESQLVKIVGRAEVIDKGIAPYTTGAGMAFYADCAGDITVTVSGSSLKWDKQCLAVFVDGVEQERLIFDCPNYKEATATLTVATGLADGVHRIELYRDTEEVFGEITFETITLDGTISPVPASPMLFEFIGDSLTCGYASYPHEDKSTSVEHPLWEAGSRSFAALTARAMGADFQSVCASGYGIICGWNGDRVTLGDMYDYASYYNSDNEWAFERKADVVVINLGTNDSARMAAWSKDEEDVGDGIRALLEQVRAHNPDAKIVWATGMAGVKFKEQATAHIAQLGGSEAGYYYVELPFGMSSDGGHPTLEEHAAASAALVSFLKSDVLPPDAVMMTAETAQQIDTASLPADVAAKLALEITIAQSIDTPNGILAGLCEEYGLQVSADGEAQDTAQDGGMDMTLIVIVAVAALVIIGLVLFAILYKPKKAA